MRQESGIYQGKRFVRVGKVAARTVYNNGNKVLLLPEAVRFENMWVHPCPVCKADDVEERTFYQVVKDYEYYNCVCELGKYAKFFVPEELAITRRTNNI